MAEKRKVKRRQHKAHTHFPAINHGGEVILSERRHLPTRRVCDIYVKDVEDVDLPTMFLGASKQI